MSFKNEGEIKTFPDKREVREFITTRPALQEMMKGTLPPKTKQQKYTRTKEQKPPQYTKTKETKQKSTGEKCV